MGERGLASGYCKNASHLRKEIMRQAEFDIHKE